MRRLRLPLLLLLGVLLSGCVCAPATVPLTGAPSDEEIAQARRAFGAGDAPSQGANSKR